MTLEWYTVCSKIREMYLMKWIRKIVRDSIHNDNKGKIKTSTSLVLCLSNSVHDFRCDSYHNLGYFSVVLMRQRLRSLESVIVLMELLLYESLDIKKRYSLIPFLRCLFFKRVTFKSLQSLLKKYIVFYKILFLPYSHKSSPCGWRKWSCSWFFVRTTLVSLVVSEVSFCTPFLQLWP